MKRRTLLTVGLATGALLAAAGGTLALLQPGRVAGKLSDASRRMLAAVARAVLASTLADQPAALQAHLNRVEVSIAGLPPGIQAEIDELLSIVASAPGRIALVGLTPRWDSATVAEVSAALQSMRTSSLALRQQAYHALRDITNASYFADPSTWRALAYPGPRAP